MPKSRPKGFYFKIVQTGIQVYILRINMHITSISNINPQGKRKIIFVNSISQWFNKLFFHAFSYLGTFPLLLPKEIIILGPINFNEFDNPAAI